MTITIKKTDQIILEKEISSFSIGEVLSVMLTGGYIDVPLQKGSLCTIELFDGDTTITKLCTFLIYQFNVQTYQQTIDGVSSTVTGVVNNSLVFNLVE